MALFHPRGGVAGWLAFPFVVPLLNSAWRLWGLLRWLAGAKGGWGQMQRTASWKKPAGTGGS